MDTSKSFYEQSEQDIAAYTPTDFTEAYIKAHAELVEEWQQTTWLEPNGPMDKVPGRNQRERDLNRARYARVMQNYVDQAFPPTRVGGNVIHVKAAEMVENLKKRLPENARLPETSLELGEAASAVSTSAWSGATLLPMVLGYARKIMPKQYALQFYQVQPLDRPSGRVFFIARQRDANGTTSGQVEQRAGWSYRSFANDPGENAQITNAVTLAITSANVAAPTSHKLLAQTTIEVEQDLRAYFGFDAVALVSEIATDEMALELDEILIRNLYDQCVSSGTGQYQYGQGTLPTAFQYDPGAYDRRVFELLTRASLGVWMQKRVMPNYFISGTEWQVILANTSLYPSSTPGEIPINSFLNPLGTLKVGGGIQHYVANLPFPRGEGVLGYKGVDYVDGNAFYLPYIPLQLTGVLFDPNKQDRTLSWISRYSIYNHKWTGQNSSYAWLTTSASLSGLSYPAQVEYV